MLFGEGYLVEADIVSHNKIALLAEPQDFGIGIGSFGVRKEIRL